MAKLSEAEIEDRLNDADGWGLEDGQISRSFAFDSFLDAIEFVRRVAGVAEAQDHHPDIDIRYSQVKIAVSSHDVGGITDRDFKLAAAISAL